MKPLLKIKLQKTGKYASLSIWFVIAIFPLFWALMTSLKLPVQAFDLPPVLIFKPVFMHYRKLWTDGGFVKYLLNTLTIAGVVVIVSVFVSSLGAYGLARSGKGKAVLLLIVSLIFRALPKTSYLLPYYTLSRRLGLYDTKLILILIFIAVEMPFALWLLRGFFRGIPDSIEDAAMIDGCTRTNAFFRVIVPLMGPGMATVALFTFMLAYQEYMIPLILTSTRAMTLPVAIQEFGGKLIRYWSVSAAGCVSISIPIIIVILFGSKYYVAGLTAGSVKN